jgi:hypothetical protein
MMPHTRKTPYPARYSAGRGSEAGRYSTTTRSGFREAGKKGRRVSEIPEADAEEKSITGMNSTTEHTERKEKEK